MKKRMVIALLAVTMGVTQMPRIPALAQEDVTLEEPMSPENSGGGD